MAARRDRGDAEVVRQPLIEDGDELQEPAQAQPRHAADAAQGEAFEQQPSDEGAGVVRDPLRVGDELPPAPFAAVVLLAVVGVAVLLRMR